MVDPYGYAFELSRSFVEPVISDANSKNEQVRWPFRWPSIQRTPTDDYFELAERDFLRYTLAYAASIGYDIDELNKMIDLTWVIDLLKAHCFTSKRFFDVFDFSLFLWRTYAEKYVPDIGIHGACCHTSN
jgi:hypothetical protein